MGMFEVVPLVVLGFFVFIMFSILGAAFVAVLIQDSNLIGKYRLRRFRKNEQKMADAERNRQQRIVELFKNPDLRYRPSWKNPLGKFTVWVRSVQIALKKKFGKKVEQLEFGFAVFEKGVKPGESNQLEKAFFGE